MSSQPTEFSQHKELLPQMTAQDVIDLYQSLADNNIKIIIDGGWAVDALLGSQSRPHEDVDVVVDSKDLTRFNKLLTTQGYLPLDRPDTRPWNFVLADTHQHQVDVHVISPDSQGNGIYGPIENGQYYPAGSLTSTGLISGFTVNCISPEYIIESHQGYPLRPKDIQDVTALCQKFHLAYPPNFPASDSKSM